LTSAVTGTYLEAAAPDPPAPEPGHLLLLLVPVVLLERRLVATGAA